MHAGRIGFLANPHGVLASLQSNPRKNMKPSTIAIFPARRKSSYNARQERDIEKDRVISVERL